MEKLTVRERAAIQVIKSTTGKKKTVKRDMGGRERYIKRVDEISNITKDNNAGVQKKKKKKLA